MDEQAAEARRKLAARDEALTGTVRLSAIDDLAAILSPIVASFRRQAPRRQRRCGHAARVRRFGAPAGGRRRPREHAGAPGGCPSRSTSPSWRTRFTRAVRTSPGTDAPGASRIFETTRSCAATRTRARCRASRRWTAIPAPSAWPFVASRSSPGSRRCETAWASACSAASWAIGNASLVRLPFAVSDPNLNVWLLIHVDRGRTPACAPSASTPTLPSSPSAPSSRDRPRSRHNAAPPDPTRSPNRAPVHGREQSALEPWTTRRGARTDVRIEANE